ncbi:hypothetical protein [Pedococcus soli]
MSSSMSGTTSPSSGSSATPTGDERPELRGAGTEELVALMQANGRGRQRGRMLALVGAVLGVVALGTGGFFAFNALTDPGPQPESVLPSSTVAFVKVDLDPSASQKVDALRFLRSFPDAAKQLGAGSDLRKIAFEAVQKQGRLGKVDYAKDVAPWLGQRLGVGFVPDAAADEGAAPVLVLAVTDVDAAERHLPALAAGLGGQCRVLQAFAVCTGGTTTTSLDKVVADATRASLADAATFREDLGDLGDDGVVTAWVDSAKAGELISRTSALTGSRVPVVKSADAGRTVMALRFDGPNLELAGHVNGAKGQATPAGNAGAIATLPWNTLAAVSVGGAGDGFTAAWPQLQATIKASVGDKQYAAGLADVQKTLGISVPKDVAAALGSQFTVVFGGMEPGKGPRLAIVGDGDADVLRKVVGATAGLAGGGPATVHPAGGGTVVSLSDDYGQEVSTTHGLGDMPAFKDAIEHPESAQVAVYVDIAGLASQFKDDLGTAKPATTSVVDHLSALGITATSDGSGGDFAIRLTTK